MKKDPLVFIEHILESIRLVEQYTSGLSEGKFFISSELQDAVIRRIEIMGEAIKNVSAQVKKKYPEVPWKEIIGMRNILIHEYFGVDLRLAWRVVKKDIPRLKKDMLKIKKQLLDKQ
jgi:uncharacterized protein with HEPN domain